MSATTAPAPTATGGKAVIGVIFYSMYGHIGALAEEVIKGVEAAGAICKPYQIAETLPGEVLEKMHAGNSLKPKYPLITPEELATLDGFLLGTPTRYGRTPAQVSAFFDRTGGLWATGAMVGKFASTFTSTASQHGGQETTHLTTIPFFAHHGIIYVPIGYSQAYLTDLAVAHGGSAYGVSTMAAGDGSRTPEKGELDLARYQGEYFAKVVSQSVRGRHLLAADRSGTSGYAANAPGQQSSDLHSATKTAGSPPVDSTGHHGGAAAAGAAAVGAAGVGAAAHSASGQPTSTSHHTGTAGNTEGYSVGDKALNSTTGATGATGTGAPGTGATGTGATGTTGALGTTGHNTAPTAQHSAPGATGATTGTTPATGSTAPAAASRVPGATAPKEKKSGGLFSCCSTNSID